MDDLIIKNPESLINFLKMNCNLNKIYQEKVRHYTIEIHTLLVLKQFEKYFSKIDLPIRSNVFRLMLALHDIGKPKAFKEGNLGMQHKYNIELIDSISNTININYETIKIIKSLVSNDILGSYLQNKISVVNTIPIIHKMAKYANLTSKDYFRLITVYYQCDAGSYTFDAGGKYYLEYLFEYENGLKVFDITKNRLKFSKLIELKYSELEESINYE